MNFNQYNPYNFTNQRFQAMDNQIYPQQIQQPMQQPVIQTNKPMILGKTVDSIDVVKAMEIPLDGEISYFPLTDGSAIITKQLQQDGTSKIVIFKPSVEDKMETTKFATLDDIQSELKKFNYSDEIKLIKKEIKKIKSKLNESDDDSDE